MGGYARLVTNYPWLIILLDIVVVFVCGPVGIWQAGLPDFSNPNEGYEPRGTDIRGRDLANTRLVEGIILGTFSYSPGNHRHDNSTTPPSVITPTSSTSTDTDIACVDEEITGVTVRALPPALRATQALEDSTALPRFIVQAKNSGQSLWSVEHIKAICDIEDQYIKQPFEEMWPSGGSAASKRNNCPALSLPYYISYLQNTTCQDITQHDLDEVYTLLQDCSQHYFLNRLQPMCQNTSCGAGVPSKCSNRNIVHYIFHYFTDVNFFKNESQDNFHEHLTYSPIIFRRSWNISKDELYDYYKAYLLERQISDDIVEVKAIDMDLIFGEVNTYYVLTDLPYYGLAMALVVVVLFFYLRSFALMIIVMLNVGLSLMVAYFIYFVVCRFVYFGFTNLLAGLLLIAIGADDVFIFHDIWNKIKSEAPNDDINIEDLTSHTLKHAFLSILVTSLTTAAALFANSISAVIALRCFGIFGGICITVNLFFMVTLVPSILVMLEKFSRKYPSCCKWQCIDACIQILHNFSEYVWSKIIPKVVVKGSLVWIVIFLAAGIYGFVVVFYDPQLRLPDSEIFQVFYADHPFEVYRFKVKDKLRFEIENKELSKVSIELNFVFGVSGRDNGNVFDPKDTGVLQFDNNFNIYPLQNSEWMKTFCTHLINDNMIADKTKYVCFMELYENTVKSKCVYHFQNSNITLPSNCCEQNVSLSESDAMSCYSNGDFINTIRMKAGNKTLIGAPIYESGNLIAMAFQVKTTQYWTARFTDMDSFYNHFQALMKTETESAPEGLRHGWFSGAFGRELYFYDLQDVMVRGCIAGIGLSMGVAFLIMLVTSGNFFITMYAIFTIVLIIVVTVGILVLLGWELGVSEALVITLTVGLSIDFTIHFGVAYKVSREKHRAKRVEDSISTVGFAVTMAALTTFLAGSALMGGRVLSYYRFGLFLMLDMTVSWVYALFFFLPVCRFIGPVGSFGELSVLFSCCRSNRSNMKDNEKQQQEVTGKKYEHNGPDIPMSQFSDFPDHNILVNTGHKLSLSNGVDIIRHSSKEPSSYDNSGYALENGTVATSPSVSNDNITKVKT